MRKKVFGRKFKRDRDSRQALFKGLVRSLFLNGHIETTKTRAKAIQGDVDKLITLAKKDTDSAKRRVFAKVGNDHEALAAILGFASNAKGRTSGYTRIIKLPKRLGDLADIAKLEFVDKVTISSTPKVEEKETKKKSRAKKAEKKGE